MQCELSDLRAMHRDLRSLGRNLHSRPDQSGMNPPVCESSQYLFVLNHGELTIAWRARWANHRGTQKRPQVGAEIPQSCFPEPQYAWTEASGEFEIIGTHQ